MTTRRWMGILGVTFLTASVGHAQLGGAAPGRDLLGAPPEYHYWISVGPVTVGEGEIAGGMVALGAVTVAGEVRGDVLSVGGGVTLAKGSTVTGNVTAIRAGIDRAKGAKVFGEVQPDRLPELDLVELSPSEHGTNRVHFGAARIDGEELASVVVVGGDLTVGADAQIGLVVVMGGDLIVEAGGTCRNVQVAGGSVTAPETAEVGTSKATAPQVLKCGGQTPGTSARSWIMPRNHREDSYLQVHMDTTDPWRAIIEVKAPTALGINLKVLTVACARRLESTRPPANESSGGGRGGGGGFGGGGGGGEATWPTAPIYVADDADPLFAASTAIGTAIKLEARVRLSQPYQGQRNQPQTIALAVPSDAGVLVGMGD